LPDEPSFWKSIHACGEARASFASRWGKTEADLADALSEAKTSGALVKGGRFDIRLWTHAAEPPPPRWTTLAEMDRDELTIIAGREDGKTTAATDTGVARLMSDGEISTWYANNLPPVT
jgi:hypothetical protein